MGKFQNFFVKNKSINISEQAKNLSSACSIYDNEIDQSLKVSEVISSNDKNNNLCTLTISLWNCRSFTYEKKSLMNSRDDDIIMLNETWDNKLNVSG